MSGDRCSWLTSQQMRDAPRDAVFIWCNSDLCYPKRLAAHLDRTDLQIVSPYWLWRDQLWRLETFTGIVVDHAATLNAESRDLLHEIIIHSVKPGGA